MPRANRHFLPGHVWHITHRCHKKEFLLKFARDRRRWLHWLFQARKRFGLCVLNYIVTSNHIHLLVRDRGRGEIARSMQLIAGRTGQEYNRRKDRQGAFWEDRYHATAVDTQDYLARCLVYIDLNMVRAGVVSHPLDWPHGGYQETQAPPQRYAILYRSALLDLLSISNLSELQRLRRQWVEEALRADRSRREALWTESLAAGSEAFVERVRARLGVHGRCREIIVAEDMHFLREPSGSYTVLCEPEKVPQSPQDPSILN
jgi:putative transposase